MESGCGLGGVGGDWTLEPTNTSVVDKQVRPPGPPTPEGQPGDAGGGTATTAAPVNRVHTGRISDCEASILSAVNAAADACGDTAGPLRTIITGIGANLGRLERSAPRDPPRTIGAGAVAALIGTLDRNGYGAFGDIVVTHWDGTSAAPTAEPPTPLMTFVAAAPTAAPTAFAMTSTPVGPTGPERVPTPAEMDEMDEFFADVNGPGDETSVDGDGGSAGGAIRRTTPTDKSAARAGPYGGRGNDEAGRPLPGLSDVAPMGVDCVWTPRPGWTSGVYEHKGLAGSPGHPGLHAYRYIVVESTAGKKTMTVWTWAPDAGADGAKKSGAAGARPLPPWATAFFGVAGWPSANCGGLVRGPATVPVCVQRKEILNPIGSSYFQDPKPIGKANPDSRVIRSDYRCLFRAS